MHKLLQNILPEKVASIILRKAGFKKILANVSWLAFEKIIALIITLAVGIYVARYLGPENFGILNYSQSFVGLFLAIATLGLDGLVIRELVKNDDQRDVLLGTTFFLKLTGSIFLLFIVIFASQSAGNDNATNTIIFIITTGIIFQSFNNIDFYFQSKVESRYSVFVKTIAIIIISSIKICLIIFKANLIYFAIVISVESLLIAIGLIFIFKKRSLSIFDWRFDKRIAISLLRDSWPMILSGVVVSIYTKIDQVMIKEIMT